MIEEKKKDREIIKKSLLVICGVVFLFAVTYAIFTYTGYGTKENRLATGTLILTLDDTTSEGISLANAIPVTNEDGLTSPSYTFAVENTGTLSANYRVSLVEDSDKYIEHGCTAKKMAWSNIKYSITKSTGSSIDLLSENTGILDTGTLAPGEKKSYTLQLWISDTAGNDVMGTHFHGKIEVKAIQEGHTNYETGE